MPQPVSRTAIWVWLPCTLTDLTEWAGNHRRVLLYHEPIPVQSGIRVARKEFSFMDQPVCVIVGAGPGVGVAVARRFGREGFRVALLARSTETLQRVEAELAQEGLTTRNYRADAGDLAELASVLAQVTAEMGPPVVLVYNAVAFTPGPLSKLNPTSLLDGLRVSAAGALAAAQAVLPAMHARGSGTLLFTGGGASAGPIPNLTSLSLGKAALRMLALGLAKELAGSGIRVGLITIYGEVAPGTPFDPERIAAHYWVAHTRPAGSDEVEIHFRGEEG
jgi:short-subunit dehydrogenase